MNAPEVLKAVRAAGGEVVIVDGAPRLRAPHALPDELVAAARRCKSELVSLLIEADVSNVGEQAPSQAPPPEASNAVLDLRAAWRGALLELGELAGWPRLPFKQAYSVPSGAASWRQFTVRASVGDMRLVLEAVRSFVASLPRPQCERP